MASGRYSQRNLRKSGSSCCGGVMRLRFPSTKGPSKKCGVPVGQLAPWVSRLHSGLRHTFGIISYDAK